MTDRTDLAANYATAFSGALPFGTRPALLIVDLVNAYLDPASPLCAGEMAQAALQSNVRLATCARASGVPVIFTNVVYTAGGIDGGLFYRKVPALKAFDLGSPFGAFPDALSPAPGELVVTKQYASSFFGTSLASTLAAQKIDTVLITGYSTSGCVRATALDALQHGFAPFVVADGCADRHQAPHDANLFDLKAKYAEVIDERTALELMSTRATTRP